MKEKKKDRLRIPEYHKTTGGGQMSYGDSPSTPSACCTFCHPTVWAFRVHVYIRIYMYLLICIYAAPQRGVINLKFIGYKWRRKNWRPRNYVPDYSRQGRENLGIL